MRIFFLSFFFFGRRKKIRTEMQKESSQLKDDVVEFNKKLTKLRCVKIGKILRDDEARSTSEGELARMDIINCPGCRGDGENNSSQRNPHIQDLCPADREKIAQLVEKLAECTQAKHKAEAELAVIRSENESLINRYEVHCNEHENEKSSLRQQLDIVTSREKTLKLESARSLNSLSDQLDVQEKEFVKLTETVRDLLREKIQLQNILIERESRIKIAESKLERAKETLEMEKLLFIKEHARDSVLRNFRDRGTQTHVNELTNLDNKKNLTISEKTNISTKIKSKDDLEDPSSDGILLRSLFFKPSSTYDDDNLSNLDALNSQTIKK